MAAWLVRLASPIIIVDFVSTEVPHVANAASVMPGQLCSQSPSQIKHRFLRQFTRQIAFSALFVGYLAKILLPQLTGLLVMDPNSKNLRADLGLIVAYDLPRLR